MRLAAGQQYSQKTAFSIADCVDFRVSSATRAPDRLILLPPFSARSRAMCFDMGRIDHLQMRRERPLGDGVEQLFPDSTPCPTDKAVVDRGVRAVFRRQIAPATSGLQHMEDTADHPAVIDTLTPDPSRSLECRCAAAPPISARPPARSADPARPDASHHRRAHARSGTARRAHPRCAAGQTDPPGGPSLGGSPRPPAASAHDRLSSRPTEPAAAATRIPLHKMRRARGLTGCSSSGTRPGVLPS